MTKVHDLKILPIYFDAVVSGAKSFEIRRDDRDFSVGDVLLLNEYDSDADRTTGRFCTKRITYKFSGPGYGLDTGFCALSIAPTLPDQAAPVSVEAHRVERGSADPAPTSAQRFLHSAAVAGLLRF